MCVCVSVFVCMCDDSMKYEHIDSKHVLLTVITKIEESHE